MAINSKGLDKGQETSLDDGGQQEFFLPDLCNVHAVLFLVLVAELLAIVLEVVAKGIAEFSWASLALTSLFVQWCFLLNATLLCRLRPILANWPLARAAATSYLLIIVVVIITTVTADGLVYIDSEQTRVDRLLTNIVICAVLAGITLRYFYLTQQLRVRQRTELQARIQALQSRIRPHFLFNSMNIIASLIAVDQDAAETAVEDLSSLFRASLAEVNTEVTLAEELELCRRYTRIEQLRLGQRLHMDWQVDSIPQTVSIPSLSLQPLLENAIYHGIQQLPSGGTVAVIGKYEQGILAITVSNAVLEGAPAESDGNQIALENIRQRLQALYGAKATLMAKKSNNNYVVTMSYPIAEITEIKSS